MNRIFLSLVLFFFVISCSTEKTTWPETSQTTKPWTRWWWMNNAVDKENLSRELNEFAEMGIGGVEITPIYGVRGEEERTIEFLSPEFSDVINYTIDVANNLGLGVDLPPGSGWRCGAPFVPKEKGLWNLKIEKIEFKKDEKIQPSKQFENIACASFLSDGGETEIIDPTGTFTSKTNGTVYLALRVKSGDKVKRPSVGGEGWAIDTFNDEITNWYLEEFWKKLGIDEGKLRCFFHDSFEYTGDFTTNFLEEFKNRRGYNLAGYLYALDPDCEDKELTARVKSDYRETLSDLVLESFIQPMTKWAHEHKSLNRNQAHGSPGNILDLYAACDIPETEIFQRVAPGEPDIFVNKFASSAAHVTGQKLVSSESYTWLDEHWTVTPSELVKATNRFFLAGINHMFFHGTCYSPEDAKWPGWLFYASTQLNNRNPIWREMPTLFKYIERTQSVLQNSTPQSDVLIYWPYFDVAASEGRIFNHLGVNKDAGWFNSHPISELSKKLTKAGYTFDYISDRQLQDLILKDGKIITSGNSAYNAVVIPETKYIPLETMQKLSDLNQNGAKVIFDQNLPESVPGVFEQEKRATQLSELRNKIDSEWVGESIGILQNNRIKGEKDISEKGFQYVKMIWGEDDCYLIFNMNEEEKDEWVELNSPAKTYVFLDPMNGDISTAEVKKGKVRVQLEPEEIVFVKCVKNSDESPTHLYFEENLKARNINGRWKVEFLDGGPVYPGNIDINKLESWTKSGDQETERFCGTARYSLDFEWDGDVGGFLDLGKVNDCARVKINDKDFGTLLGPSFSVHIDNLQKGLNKIQVEVTNVAANRIRDLDIKGVEWRRFYDINLVNIDYGPFDASGWEIKDAGLLGPVNIYSK